MKKLLFIAIAVTMSVGIASAQSTSGTVVLKSSATHAPTDTVVNTAVKLQSAPLSMANNVAGVQVTLTKISGTVAGIVRVYASVDGVGYVKVDSLAAASFPTNNGTTSVNLFKVNPWVGSNIRVGYTGVGTMSVKLNSQAVYRKD